VARIVGFVGLGNVGGPMAVNLLKAGFDVVGFDVRPNSSFVEAGGRMAASCEEIAAAAPLVIHSLPNETAIAASVDALLKAPLPDRVLIEMSSFALAAKLAQAERLARVGAAMLDCEVSGLPPQVAARKAVIFKAGDAGIIGDMTAIFDAIAEKHFNLGPFGAATKMKLIANTMVCVHNLMAAEALNLGKRAGLSPDLMIEVLGPSAAGSSTFSNKAPLMAQRRFANGLGPFRHMFSYLGRASELATQVGAASPLLDMTQRLYAVAERENRHDQDIAAMIEIVEELQGGEIQGD
jgi:3-hydroxyisobutyrate dehydrogenase-like beta-hydroxyacid dehydrogenase